MGKKRNQRKTKLIITFDKNDRKEYLLGFHKRKKQRRQAALTQLKQQAKSDRKGELDSYYKNFSTITKPSQNGNEEILKALPKRNGEELSVRTTTEVTDNIFSKEQFGSSKVTITTSKLENISSEDEEESKPAKPARQKRIKLAPGKAEKMLRKFQAKRDKKKARRQRRTKRKK
eukprot:maker-scaffold_17-snap-gene-3.36-mRNA-1 protein AED:0.02 eAED:0.02 QI:90/1/1/1/1/1/3/160/173